MSESRSLISVDMECRYVCVHKHGETRHAIIVINQSINQSSTDGTAATLTDDE
jgi:hypothetical protein